MAKYCDHDKPFVVINNNGTPLPSVNVCAGPYNSVSEARSEAINIFNSISNIPDGLETKIWVDDKLIDYVWYDRNFQEKVSSNNSNFNDFKLEFIFTVTTTTTSPDQPINSQSPIGWKSQIGTSDSGYVWMSCGKKVNNTLIVWNENSYWSTPMLLGQINSSGSGTGSGTEGGKDPNNPDPNQPLCDLKEIYTLTDTKDAPTFNRKTPSVPYNWTSKPSTEDGYIWYSRGKINTSGIMIPHDDGNYWTEPIYRGHNMSLPTWDLASSTYTAYRKITNAIYAKSAGFLNRDSYNCPPDEWTLDLQPLMNADEPGFIYKTTAAKTSDGTYILQDDSKIWSKPEFVLEIGDTIPVHLAELTSLFGVVQCTYDWVPKLVDGQVQEFSTTLTLRNTKTNEAISGNYDIYLNKTLLKRNERMHLTYARDGKTPLVDVYLINNTITFYALTSWTDQTINVLSYQLVGKTSSDDNIECRSSYVLTKVPAGESIEGIEGSVIRYRGYLKNLKDGDILCYKCNEQGMTDGVTYIDYVKAYPSEFIGGDSLGAQTYYMFVGSYSSGQEKGNTYKVNTLVKPYLDDFVEAKKFQFIATDVLLAENALIKNLQSKTLFFYKEGAVLDDDGECATDDIRGAITGDPSLLGKTIDGKECSGNYMIFGGKLKGDQSVWENPNFRIDGDGLLHIRYSSEADEDSINYKGYFWDQTVDSLTSKYYDVKKEQEGIISKYSTFYLDIDKINAKVERYEALNNDYINQYAEWELTVEGFRTKAVEETRKYNDILQQYSEFEVKAAQITSTVTELLNDQEKYKTQLTQTATSLAAEVYTNGEIRTALGLSDSGIDMVGKSIYYRLIKGAEPILTCNSMGLAIKGSVEATTLIVGKDGDGNGYMTYDQRHGLEVEGAIRAVTLTVGTSGSLNLLTYDSTSGLKVVGDITAHKLTVGTDEVLTYDSTNGLNVEGNIKATTLYAGTESEYLQYNSTGLTVKGNITATTLLAGSKSGSYLEYNNGKLKVVGDIEATKLTVGNSEYYFKYDPSATEKLSFKGSVYADAFYSGNWSNKEGSYLKYTKESGLEIGGVIKATELYAGNVDGTSGLSYTSSGLKVKGIIEASALIFTGDSPEGLDRWFEKQSSKFASTDDFKKALADLQAQITKTVNDSKTALDKAVAEANAAASAASGNVGEAVKTYIGSLTLTDLVNNVKGTTANLADFFDKLGGKGSFESYMTKNLVVTPELIATSIEGNEGTFVLLIADTSLFKTVLAGVINSKTVNTNDLTIYAEDGTDTGYKIFESYQNSNGEWRIKIPKLDVAELTISGVNIIDLLNGLEDPGSNSEWNGDNNTYNITNLYISYTGGTIAGWVINEDYLHSDNSTEPGNKDSIWLIPNGYDINDLIDYSNGSLLNSFNAIDKTYDIDLCSENIVISAGNTFAVTKQGSLFSNKGVIGNWVINENVLLSKTSTSSVNNYFGYNKAYKNCELFLDSNKSIIQCTALDGSSSATQSIFSSEGLFTSINQNWDFGYTSGTSVDCIWYNRIGQYDGILGGSTSGDKKINGNSVGNKYALCWDQDTLIIGGALHVVYRGNSKYNYIDETDSAYALKYIAYTGEADGKLKKFIMTDVNGVEHLFYILNGILVNAIDNKAYVNKVPNINDSEDTW